MYEHLRALEISVLCTVILLSTIVMERLLLGIFLLSGLVSYLMVLQIVRPPIQGFYRFSSKLISELAEKFSSNDSSTESRKKEFELIKEEIE